MSTTDSPFTDAPVFDTVNARRIELLQKTVAKGATPAELATFLELCGKYDLDPFAKEAWCAISDSGGKRNVLIMIGRDGLRKIAMRQGFVIDGDIVHENDAFTVTRNPDRTRTITHVYAEKERGPVLGAWAEVYDGEGKQRGYFYALMTEYRPKSEAKLRYSPWGSQESVMILAAAERTALSMATPLSGVVAQGELDRAQERADLTAGTGSDLDVTEPLPPAVEAILVRARDMGHGLQNRQAAYMAVTNQPEAAVKKWCRDATAILNRVGAGKPEPEPEDAVVVESDPCLAPGPADGAFTPLCSLTAGHTGEHNWAERMELRARLQAEARERRLSDSDAQTANPPSDPVASSEAPAEPPGPGESASAEVAERIVALQRRNAELEDAQAMIPVLDSRQGDIDVERAQIADEIARLEGPGEGQATLL